MRRKRDRPAITPEMIEAGAFALERARDEQSWSADEIARKIYTAMEAQRVRVPSQRKLRRALLRDLSLAALLEPRDIERMLAPPNAIPEPTPPIRDDPARPSEIGS